MTLGGASPAAPGWKGNAEAMPRLAPAESEPVNADSFLDIVASVVSVMIIMVMMVGLKIKYTPVEATTLAIPAAALADDAVAAQATQAGPERRPASWSGCGKKFQRRATARRPRAGRRRRRGKARSVAPSGRQARRPGPGALARAVRGEVRVGTVGSASDGCGSGAGRSRPGGQLPHAAEPGSPRGGTPFSTSRRAVGVYSHGRIHGPPSLGR